MVNILGFPKHGDTPSHHPFINRCNFPWNKPSSYRGTPILGNHHIGVDSHHPKKLTMCALKPTGLGMFGKYPRIPGMNDGKDERTTLCHWQPWSKFHESKTNATTLPALSGSHVFCTHLQSHVYVTRFVTSTRIILQSLSNADIGPHSSDHMDKDPTLEGVENRDNMGQHGISHTYQLSSSSSFADD